jgi:hypothetical protein
VKLSVAGIHQPFHFGLGFGAELCGYYLFRFYRFGVELRCRDEAGWCPGLLGKCRLLRMVLLGLERNPGVRPRRRLLLLRERQLGRSQPPLEGIAAKTIGATEVWKTAKTVSIELRARGVFRAQLTIPQTLLHGCIGQGGFASRSGTAARSPVQSGYYGYGRAGDKEGRKERWAHWQMKPQKPLLRQLSQRTLLLGKQQCPTAAASGAGGLEHPQGAGRQVSPSNSRCGYSWGAPVAPDWSAGGDGHVPMAAPATSTAGSTKSLPGRRAP